MPNVSVTLLLFIFIDYFKKSWNPEAECNDSSIYLVKLNVEDTIPGRGISWKCIYNNMQTFPSIYILKHISRQSTSPKRLLLLTRGKNQQIPWLVQFKKIKTEWCFFKNHLKDETNEKVLLESLCELDYKHLHITGSKRHF